jgi:3-hydroxyisobutyrate dehydrogenase-like beta-hydroxyacid dehydrogenase
MGAPAASHIQRAGFPLTVYDLRQGATAPFVQHGAAAAESVNQLVSRSEIIITALPMPADVEAVARQIAAAISADKIYIDISTSPPALIRKLEALFSR